jgi:hypothetical protein
MNNDKLREEWEKVCDTRNYKSGRYRRLIGSPVHDPHYYPESEYELDADKVADWWLEKMKAERERFVDRSKNVAQPQDAGWEDSQRTVRLSDIISLLGDK